MGSRSHSTFKKRQKEQARTEKAREKMERRLQRKHDRDASGESSVIIDSESDLKDSSLDVLDVETLDATISESDRVSTYSQHG